MGDLEAVANDDETEDTEEVIFDLPPGLSVRDTKCLSVWSQNKEVGFAHMLWQENN